ncbi:MAG: EH signature domain-containing protein [Betaproteobacteria bacterium]
MTNALTRLRSLLTTTVETPLARPWAVEKTIDSHIASLERRLRHGAGAFLPRDLQEEALRRFWTSKRIDNLKDARLVSFGIALPVGPNRLRVIEDGERFQNLLDGVDQFLPAPRQYRRCYQGLLAGYFAYDPEQPDCPETGRRNWKTLRSYLGDSSRKILDRAHNPEWAESLQKHSIVLGEDPCIRYGTQLLAGDHTEVDELRNALNISETSWFMRKLFLAQVRVAVGEPDEEFLRLVPPVVDLLYENQIIRDEGLALVLNRVSAISTPPLGVQLRDAAVTWWGNPWLRSNAMRWGRVTPEARALVSEWLKLEFIEAFFTLLAEERTGDNRRLEFWARYVHCIEDIHFALGSDARENQSPDFRDLRKKMAGLVVSLQDTVRTNNAFIMRMGPLVIVEFSGYSNACYGYHAAAGLPFRLDMPVVLRKDASNSLKLSNRELWLAHQDGIRDFETWEERFASELASSYGIRPKDPINRPRVSPRRSQASAPTSTPMRQGLQPTRGDAYSGDAALPAPHAPSQETETGWDIARWLSTDYSRRALSHFAQRFGLQIDDLTLPPHGGNLWIRTDDSHLGVNEVLIRWGFQYKNARKGWWWKGR